MSRDGYDLNYPAYPYPINPYSAYPVPVYQNPYVPGPYIQPQPYPMPSPHYLHKPLKTDTVVQTEAIILPKKPETQFEFNHLYKKPLNSFEFTDFREKTLPMLRLNKIIKTQALVRGWYTRKYILPFKKRIHFYGKRIRDSLLEEFIEDNLLPEIILEIINTNFAYKDYGLYTPDFRILVEIADGIENKVINLVCEEVVKELMRFIVNDYLRKRNEELVVNQKFDPLHIVADELTEIVIDKEIRMIVPAVVREEASRYLLESKVIGIIDNQFIPTYIREIINEAAWEIAQERYFDEKLDIIISQNINDIIIDSAEAEKDRIDLEALDNAFAAFLQRSILKEAINELVFMNKEYHDQEFLNQKYAAVPKEELNDFAMDDDFYSSPPKNYQNEGRRIDNRKEEKIPIDSGNSPYSDPYDSKPLGSRPGKVSPYGNPLGVGGSGSREVGTYRESSGRNEGGDGKYEVPNGFTAPKSPRNRRKPAGVIENAGGHGRTGTNTFYKD